MQKKNQNCKTSIKTAKVRRPRKILADEREILREQRIAGFAGEQRFSSYFSRRCCSRKQMYKVNQFQINLMNIQGIYNCAHPRLNNKKHMTTVTEEAYERCDRMMLVTRVMGMGGGGGDGLMGLVKVTVMTR